MLIFLQFLDDIYVNKLLNNNVLKIVYPQDEPRYMYCLNEISLESIFE